MSGREACVGCCDADNRRIPHGGIGSWDAFAGTHAVQRPGVVQNLGERVRKVIAPAREAVGLAPAAGSSSSRAVAERRASRRGCLPVLKRLCGVPRWDARWRVVRSGSRFPGTTP